MTSRSIRALLTMIVVLAISAVTRVPAGQSMGLQYLDALNVMGKSLATKWLLPLEPTDLLPPMMDQAGNGAGREM